MLKVLFALVILCLAACTALWFHGPIWRSLYPIETPFFEDTRVRERETLEKTYTLADTQEARITVQHLVGEPYTIFIFQNDEAFTWKDGDYGLPLRAANQTGTQQTVWFPMRRGEDFDIAIQVANNGNDDLYEEAGLHIRVETRRPEPEWLNEAADWLYSLPVLAQFAPKEPK